jgi:hypothetical protein
VGRGEPPDVEVGRAARQVPVRAYAETASLLYLLR